MGQITLKKLAELSGLSIRTVSRVLKNQAYVVPEKRELVLKLAEQYHYLPNMAARNLRLQKKSFVGILSSNFQTEVFLQKVNDLERRLFSAGYYPILGRPDHFSTDFGKMMRDWSGVMDYVVVFELPDRIPGGNLSDFPLDFIFVDRGLQADHHSLLIDRGSGVCEAIKHLIRTDAGAFSVHRNPIRSGRFAFTKKRIVTSAPGITISPRAGKMTKGGHRSSDAA